MHFNTPSVKGYSQYGKKGEGDPVYQIERTVNENLKLPRFMGVITG